MSDMEDEAFIFGMTYRQATRAMTDVVGKDWMDFVTDKELREFFEWSRAGGVYRPGDNNAGDAFRGFVKACELKHQKIADLEAQLAEIKAIVCRDK